MFIIVEGFMWRSFMINVFFLFLTFISSLHAMQHEMDVVVKKPTVSISQLMVDGKEIPKFRYLPAYDRQPTWNIRGLGLETIEDLKHIPEIENVVGLNLADNKLKFIGQRDLFKLKRLEYLILNGNQISELELGCFDHLGLQELKIRRNQLQVIEVNWLNLPELQRLDLTSNNITKIRRHAFDWLTSLQNLCLDDNPLTSFNPHIIGNRFFSKLAVISLGINKLDFDQMQNFVHYLRLLNKNIKIHTDQYDLSDFPHEDRMYYEDNDGDPLLSSLDTF
jgi:Leucine-rich repeat (LRR) protein